MKIRTILSALALLPLAVAAHAGGNWRLDSTYTYGFTGPTAAFHDLETVMGGSSLGDTYGWGSSVGYFGPSPTDEFGMSFDTTPFNEFLGGSPTEPVLKESFALGIMDALPTDAAGQTHLVLFMNPTAAAPHPTYRLRHDLRHLEPALPVHRGDDPRRDGEDPQRSQRRREGPLPDGLRELPGSSGP